MERVRVNEGTKVSLYTLFEDLQNYTFVNSKNIALQIFDGLGINALTTASGTVDASDISMKVTGVVGNNYVSVAAGEALTSGLNYVKVNPGATASTAGLSTGTHILYLKHVYAYDTPVDVMSGFAYAAPGVSQINSRAHDSTSFVWDTNPGVSGVVLASVVVDSSSNFVSCSDLRANNILKLAESVIPHTLSLMLRVPALEVSHASYPYITMISGVTSVTMTMSQLQSLLAHDHAQNTDAGTTASSFYVNYGGAPKRVLTEFDLLPSGITPLPIPALSVSTGIDGAINLSTAVSLDQLATANPTAYITVSWLGKGGGGWSGNEFTFSAFNGGVPNFTTNQYAGYYLATGAGSVYPIISNTSTKVVVSGLGSGTIGAITTNPSYYEIEFFEYKSDGVTEDEESRDVVRVYTEYTDVPNIIKSGYCLAPIVAGKKIGLRARSCYGNRPSEKSYWTTIHSLTAGVNTALQMSGISVTGQNGGVKVTWAMVTGAAYYKIIWNTDDKPPDRTDSSQQKAAATTNIYMIQNIAPNTKVRVGVYAVDAAGQLSTNMSTGDATATGSQVEDPENMRDVEVSTNVLHGDAGDRVIIAHFKYPQAAYITRASISLYGSDFHGLGSTARAKIRIYPTDTPNDFRSFVWKEGDTFAEGVVNLRMAANSFITVDALDSESPHVSFSGLLSIYHTHDTPLLYS